MIACYWFCIIFSIAYAGNIPGGKTKRNEYRKTLEEEIATLYEAESGNVRGILNELTADERRKLCKLVKGGASGTISAYSGMFVRDRYLLKYHQIEHPNTKVDAILCEVNIPVFIADQVIIPSVPSYFFLFQGVEKFIYKAKPAHEFKSYEIKVTSKIQVPDKFFAERGQN